MANIKITDLVALTDPASTDVLPIVDVGADATKKVSIADLLENAGSGTAAAPGIAFDGDSDTGIYSPGADQVAISTNGVQRINIEADGDINIDSGGVFYDATNNRLGVGTANPSAIFEVAAQAPQILLTDTDGNAVHSIAGPGNGSLLIDADAGNTGVAPSSLRLAVDGTERARIDSSGRLGLGTSSPRSLLHIQGGDVVLSTVGLGTSSATLDVVSNVTTNNGQDAAPGIAFRAPYATTSDRPTYAAIWSKKENSALGNQSGALIFGTNVTSSVGVTEKLRITSTGNVGIGVTSPGVALHVDGDIRCDGVYGETDTNTSIQFPGSDVITFNEGGSEAARIDSSGRLLVGTSTAPTATESSKALLVVNGNTTGSSQQAEILLNNGSNIEGAFGLGVIYFGGESNGQVGASISAAAESAWNTAGDTTDSPGRLVFSTTADGASNPTERMRIASNGIVYIRESDGTAGVYHQMDASANYRIGNHSGGSGNYVYLAPGGTSWVGVSDERLKTALVEIQDGLSKVSTLRAVTGRYVDDPETENRSFLIAQDVAAVLPEAVDAANPEQLGLRYTDTIPLLVAALKEAKGKIETLEQRLNDAGIA